jgi:hypothetical protein
MSYNLDGYIDVPSRIKLFLARHPEGSLQMDEPQFVEVEGKKWVIGRAHAYRTPDDQRPGIGTAWEIVPGTTPFTRGSEIQNLETSAWGRAMIASLAVESQRIASKQEVKNRQVPKRDFLAESATVDTVAGLRTLWQEARSAGADESVLTKIADKKDAIKG